VMVYRYSIDGERIELDENEPRAGSAPASSAGEESGGSVDARLRKIERQLSTLHRLVLRLTAELERKAGRADVAASAVQIPPADQIRCGRCGFLVLPEERARGHVCRRRSDRAAVLAARARAEIRPTVPSSSDGEGAGDEG
jgi:hypothetical protein